MSNFKYFLSIQSLHPAGKTRGNSKQWKGEQEAFARNSKQSENLPPNKDQQRLAGDLCAQLRLWFLSTVL